MKIIIILLLLSPAFTKKIPQQVFDVWIPLVEPHLPHCSELSNANVTEIKNMLRLMHVPNNPEFHNYIKCIYEKLGFLKPDGNFSESAILRKATYMTSELTRHCILKADSEKNLPKKSYILCDCVVNGLIEE
ncbi:hypothetical protein FQR65_LT01669 [Abscondita terminalis]|nr:hypothetical protein FQR65_LT01669 [Abscondita terminalis]